VFYYDSRSNLTCVRDPDLGLTYYTYDGGSRMTSVQNPFGEVTYYDYTPGGRMTKRVLGNDAVTYYSYDTIGRTTKVDNRRSDLTAISSFEYERDAVGNPTSILREDGSVVYYEYDAKHQLTRETQRDDQDQDLYAYEWDYDAAGNREYQVFNGTVTYYEYNAANELLTETTGADTIYYHYDGCGNTTAKQEAPGTTYYQWDHENLMTRIDFPDGGHNYFAYDADSKRVEKRDSAGYTRFVYQGPDMLRLLLERDGDGDTQVHYTMGSGLEAMRRADGGDISSGDSSFYHYDWLGSTFELTDADETVTDTYRYNAWGEVLDRTGTTDNPHTYVGNQRYYAVPGAALMLLGVRYYAMAVGRFITVDPLRVGDNWFAYSSNWPTGGVDPTGTWDMNTVHHDWTLKLARNTRVAGWEFCFPQSIARGCKMLDIWHVTTPGNWPLHFNYERARDGANWALGLGSLYPSPDTRESFFSHQRAVAIVAASVRNCRPSAYSLGYGLHAIQDMYSHMDLSTPEHEHWVNKPYVDDPGFDRMHQWNPSPVLARTPWDSLFKPYFGMHPWARQWVWRKTGARQRIRDARDRSCALLEQYLASLVGMGKCVKRAATGGPSCRATPLP